MRYGTGLEAGRGGMDGGEGGEDFSHLKVVKVGDVVLRENVVSGVGEVGTATEVVSRLIFI